MLLVRGRAGGTTLTGTLYEPDDDPPTFRGAPDDGAPYVWICDSFYEVESGGQLQRIDGQDRRVAFESPTTRGFEDREAAIEAATEHVRTQFARLGIPSADVAVDVEAVEDADAGDGGASA